QSVDALRHALAERGPGESLESAARERGEIDQDRKAGVGVRFVFGRQEDGDRALVRITEQIAVEVVTRERELDDTPAQALEVVEGHADTLRGRSQPSCTLRSRRCAPRLAGAATASAPPSGCPARTRLVPSSRSLRATAGGGC